MITKIKNAIINALYPKHIKCICCKNEIFQQNVYDMCTKCYQTLPFIKTNFCVRCGLKFEQDGSGTCLNCKSNNFAFDLARSAVQFSGAIIPTIHRLKYAKHKFLAQPLSYLLFDTLLAQDWKIDIITFVPLYPTREKERGYNQSRELASHLANLTQLPIFDDIVRLRDTPTQTNLSRRERQQNVADCFKLNNRKAIKDLNILLIDDVFTSGSTTNEIAKQLKRAGANKVYILTIAHAGFKQRF